MASGELTLRPATAADLEALNAVVERAVLSWGLPERVKRLSLPVYRYQHADLSAYQILVAETAFGEIVGVAAWEALVPLDAPPAVLLHGLYVDPGRHRGGVGTRLLEAVLDAARAAGQEGVLVRAQRDAEGFFAARGFQPVSDSEAPPRRWWRGIGPRSRH